jgi:hypothetical protein
LRADRLSSLDSRVRGNDTGGTVRGDSGGGSSRSCGYLGGSVVRCSTWSAVACATAFEGANELASAMPYMLDGSRSEPSPCPLPAGEGIARACRLRRQEIFFRRIHPPAWLPRGKAQAELAHSMEGESGIQGTVYGTGRNRNTTGVRVYLRSSAVKVSPRRRRVRRDSRRKRRASPCAPYRWL